MRKILNIGGFLLILLTVLLSKGADRVKADWWDRPSVRPTQPSYERPTSAPTSVVNPTSDPGQPTATPQAGNPTSPPSGGDGGGNDDPCAPGKSYTGPYCGWSPGVGGVGTNTSSETPRVGGPSVLGLSKTSSRDLEPSDIILLAGVLCLLLYTKSKLSIEKTA